MSEGEQLYAALRAAGVELPALRYLDVTESTNLAARQLADEGQPEWTLVVAGHQTAGRGRLGRTWVSEPGSALLFSVILRPEAPPERAALLTLLAGASMAAACADAGIEVRCKWPNDLLTGEGKVGGILLESRVAGGRVLHVVVGIGVNLSVPEGVEGAAAVGTDDRAALVAAFLLHFRAAYRPADDEFPGLVLAAYRPLCDTLGRTVRAVTTTGQTVLGTAEDVDEAGSLLVRTDAGVQAVGFGEVEHLR